MLPGISSTLSSRKISGEGQQQPLVYSIHGCNHTTAAIRRSHWIPPAWLPSSSAAGTSTMCTQSPASRVSWWAGWTQARNSSIPGVLHCRSWGKAQGASRHRAHLSVYSPVSSVCISRGFPSCTVQIIAEVAGPAQFLRTKAKGVTAAGTCSLPSVGCSWDTWHRHIHRQKRTAGSKHQLETRAKIAVALIFVRQPYRKSSWSCWTDFKMYERFGLG